MQYDVIKMTVCQSQNMTIPNCKVMGSFAGDNAKAEAQQCFVELAEEEFAYLPNLDGEFTIWDDEDIDDEGSRFFEKEHLTEVPNNEDGKSYAQELLDKGYVTYHWDGMISGWDDSLYDSQMVILQIVERGGNA